MTRPRVLVFDDDPNWTTTIKETLEPEIEVRTTNDPVNWSVQMRQPVWDAIIVDVEIIGSEDDGVTIAEKSIREFGITSPMIIITGIANLKDIQKEYKKIFFGYISKDDFNEILVDTVNDAISQSGKNNHMWNMISGIARKNKILKKDCGDYTRSDYPEVSTYMSNPNGKTIEQVIEDEKNRSGGIADINLGRSVLSVIYYELEN